MWLPRVAAFAVGVVGLAGACGGTASSPRSVVGSESHFLAQCSGECGGGFDCIGGICTRGCVTETASCGALGAGVECTNESIEPGEVAVCDARCTTESECAPLGSGYRCDAGFCRRGAAANVEVTPDVLPPSCEAFLDADVLDITGIGVFNAGTRAFYVQPEVVSCEGSQPLVQMRRGDDFLATLANGCMTSCQRAIENGWPLADEGRPGFPACPDFPCGAEPVLIEPGQTLFRPVAREVFPVRMPQMCAAGITTEAVNCFVLSEPAPGNFSLIVRGATELVCRDPAQDCSCQPRTDGSCANPNVYLSFAAGPPPFSVTLDNLTSLGGQVVTVALVEE
jgi:hypothetical protein